MDVNVNGNFYFCKAVVPYMIRQHSGSIINITSIAGKMGDITAAPVYGTSKGAINTLTKSLARQLAEYGIRVNAVAPHAIETDMSADWTNDKRQNYRSDSSQENGQARRSRGSGALSRFREILFHHRRKS
jgi:3-oxoacyl-[acyl-carrier protein] reductase